MPTERFIRDRATIRAELERRARSRQTITYGEAAALVGRTARGLGRILDAIKAEEKASGRPDLGCLVVKIKTVLPGYVGPGEDARQRAIAVQEAVFAVWAGNEGRGRERRQRASWRWSGAFSEQDKPPEHGGNGLERDRGGAASTVTPSASSPC